MSDRERLKVLGLTDEQIDEILILHKASNSDDRFTNKSLFIHNATYFYMIMNALNKRK